VGSQRKTGRDAAQATGKTNERIGPTETTVLKSVEKSRVATISADPNNYFYLQRMKSS
jgi:hypothetical protein